MNNFIFKLLILFIFFPELLLSCSEEYSDCFNCSSCGTGNLESCPCQWNYNYHSCEDIAPIIPNNIISETFSQCIDDHSSSIQKNYCGESKINIKEKYTFSLPKVNNVYGIKSLYCSYEFILGNNKISYHININNNKQYIDSTQLYLQVTFNDSTSKIFIINEDDYINHINEYFKNIEKIKLNLYFVKGYDCLPFSITIEEMDESLKDNNNNDTLIIILSVVIGFFIFGGIFYFLVKKHSQKERQRQHDLFERQLARYNGEGDENEISQRKKFEKINKLKIENILENSIINKNVNKLKIMKEKNICSICIERIKLKSRISITTCNHIFHYKCLSTWLYNNIMEPKCPNCQCNLINDENDILILNNKNYRNTNPNEEENSVRNNQENNVLRLNNNNQADKNSNSKEIFQSRNTTSKIPNRTQDSKRKDVKSTQIINSTI